MSTLPTKALPERQCALDTCRRLFVPERKDKLYCCDTHRVEAWRRQQQGIAPTTSLALPAPFAPPLPQAPRPPKKLVTQRVNDLRSHRGLTPLRADAILALLAQERALAHIVSTDPELAAEITKLRRQLEAVSGTVEIDDIATLEVDDPLLDGKMARMGVAAIRIDDKRFAVAIVAAAEEKGT